jgi:hypothetical protein
MIEQKMDQPQRNRIALLSLPLEDLLAESITDAFAEFDLEDFDEFELQKTLLSRMLDLSSTGAAASGISALIRLSTFIKERKNRRGGRRIELRYPGPNPLSSVFCDIPEQD